MATEPPDSLAKRLAWFAALWCASVAVLGVCAWLLRQVMGWAGLTV
jgi:hypothetical protein